MYIRNGSKWYTSGLKIVKTLLQNGAKIDHPIDRNPIRRAFHHNRTDILEILLKAKPNFNQPCFKFLLFETVARGKVEIAEMLIDYGFEINPHPTAGMPIHVAINYTREIEMTVMLLKKGASLKSKNKDGHTPLECALKKKDFKKHDFLKVVAYHQHDSNI